MPPREGAEIAQDVPKKGFSVGVVPTSPNNCSPEAHTKEALRQSCNGTAAPRCSIVPVIPRRLQCD
eukprot:5869818-Pyramimonas_sp.AAC.1